MIHWLPFLFVSLGFHPDVASSRDTTCNANSNHRRAKTFFSYVAISDQTWWSNATPCCTQK